MQRPGSNTNTNLATPGNIAIDQAGNARGAVKRKGGVGSVQELCIHFAAQADYEGGEFYLMQGAGNVTAHSANLDWGADSSFATHAAFNDWCKSNKFTIDAIRVVTNDTDNFEYKMTLGYRNPNNRNNPEEDINFAEHAVSQGDGLSKNFTIEGLDKVWMPSNYLKISNIKVSTYYKIYLRIPAVEQTIDEMPLTF